MKKRKLKKQEKEYVITSEDKDTIIHGIYYNIIYIYIFKSIIKLTYKCYRWLVENYTSIRSHRNYSN